MLNDEPVPIEPSLLEVHWIEELSVPCSGSLAEPENVTESPSVNSEPDDGDVMDTVGGVFGGGFTITVILSVSDAPAESVT